MPKISGENVVIYIFLVLVIVMVGLALYGYVTGAWQPPLPISAPER